MKKTLIGGIVGGVIIFIWSFLAWIILPLHEPHLKEIPNKEAVISTLQSSLTTKSVYVFPKNPGMSADQATMNAWTEKMKHGPGVMIIYDPAGSDPMMASQMGVGIVLDILAACVVAWFLMRSTAVSSSYLSRVAYCGMFGIFVSLFTHLSYWNWMGYPADFTTGLIVDAIVSWLLAGLGIAAVVKSQSSASSVTPAM